VNVSVNDPVFLEKNFSGRLGGWRLGARQLHGDGCRRAVQSHPSRSHSALRLTTWPTITRLQNANTWPNASGNGASRSWSSLLMTRTDSAMPSTRSGLPLVDTAHSTLSTLHANHFNAELLFYVMFHSKIAVNVIKGSGMKVPLSTLFTDFRFHVFDNRDVPK